MDQVSMGHARKPCGESQRQTLAESSIINALCHHTQHPARGIMGTDFSFYFPTLYLWSCLMLMSVAGRRCLFTAAVSLQLAVNKRGQVSHAYPNDQPYIVQVV